MHEQLIERMKNASKWSKNHRGSTNEITGSLCAEAADVIASLTAENESIRQNSISHEAHKTLMAEKDEEIEQLTALIPKDCVTCGYWHPKTDKTCDAPGDTPCGVFNRQAWKWRGPKRRMPYD